MSRIRLRQSRWVGVYRLNDDLACAPSFRVSFTEAMHLVHEGAAVIVNLGTAIQLRMRERAGEEGASERPWNLRDRSTKIGERVILQALGLGTRGAAAHAQSLIDGWEENHRGLDVPVLA